MATSSGTNVPLQYVYGFDQEIYTRRLDWLEEEVGRYLVFLEDEVSVTATLDHPGAHLIHFANEEELEEKIRYFVKLPYTLEASKTHQHKLRTLEEALETFTVANEGRAMRAEFGDDFCDLPHTVEGALLATSLYDQFKGIPAILCGAGPSLSQQIPLLRQIQDRALIVAGGSSFPALTSKGLVPHFACGIAHEEDEVERFFHAKGYEVPLLYTIRLYEKALQMIHGPKFYVPTGHFLEQLSFIEGGEGIFGEVSVTYTLAQILRLMGCDPILLVGVDLGYTDQERYAEGVYSTSPLNGLAHHWAFEARALATLRGATYLNANRGGREIKGMPCITLENHHFGPTKDLRGLVHQKIQQCPPCPSLKPALDQVGGSLARYLKTGSKEEMAYKEILLPMANERAFHQRRLHHELERMVGNPLTAKLAIAKEKRLFTKKKAQELLDSIGL